MSTRTTPANKKQEAKGAVLGCSRQLTENLNLPLEILSKLPTCQLQRKLLITIYVIHLCHSILLGKCK